MYLINAFSSQLCCDNNVVSYCTIRKEDSQPNIHRRNTRNVVSYSSESENAYTIKWYTKIHRYTEKIKLREYQRKQKEVLRKLIDKRKKLVASNEDLAEEVLGLFL